MFIQEDKFVIAVLLL